MVRVRGLFPALLLATSLLVGTAVPCPRVEGAPGDEEPAVPSDDEQVRREIQKSLADLASDDFAVREEARKRLASLAPRARAILEARKDDPDPEVRRTVRALLDAISPARAVEPTAPADLSRVGRVTFAGKGPLPEVLKAWDAACGGRFRVPGFAAGPEVEAAVFQTPYFQALDALLAQAKAETVEGFDEAGIATVQPANPGVAIPRAYWGAFRLDVDSVHAIREFRSPGPVRYALRLKALWSPDVQVLMYAKPRGLRAVDSEGRTWTSVDRDEATQYGAGGVRRTLQDDLFATFEAPAGAAPARLETVDVLARFRVRYDRRELRFDGPAALALPAERAGGGEDGKAAIVKATLESFGPDPALKGWTTAALSVLLPRSVNAQALSLRLDLPDGSARPMYDLQSRVLGSDGLLHLTVRASGSPADEKPAALRLVWFVREGEATVPFTVRGVPLR